MHKGQTKRVWTKEQKLQIVHKHLDEHISIKKLGKEAFIPKPESTDTRGKMQKKCGVPQ